MSNNLDPDFIAVANHLDIDELVNFSNAMDIEAKNVFKKSEYLKFLLIKKMEEEEATQITTSNCIAELDYKVEWDNNVLSALLADEVILERLISIGGYVPEHEVTTKVSGKFNMTKTKTIAKEGKKYRDVIETARVLTNPKIKFKQQ